MCTMETPTTALTMGPLRPIPIHLPRPPVISSLNYRLPIPPQLDIPPKRSMPLWNPALDLRSPVSKKVDAEPVLSPSITTSTSTSPLKSSSSTPPASPTTLTAPNSTSGQISTKSGPAFLFNQLKQSQLKTVEQTLLRQRDALSKEPSFLPPKLGQTKLVASHLPTPLTLTPPHLSPGISLIDRQQLSLQNAFALAAQSRAAMLNHVVSSHIPLQGRPSNQSHPHLQQRQHQTQQQQQQQQQLHQTLPQPLLQKPQHFFRPYPHPLPNAEGSLSLQNALALAQSRALLDRVNTSHQILSPLVSMDTASPHGYGRKLFPCPQCRYTTDRRNNLKRHMLTMHQTSSKLLECCGIFFNTKASLREHAMIFHYHGYTCYFCGRRFCRKALLKRHLSVHNGQKDFVCTVCDYATSHKSNLERHRKVHSRQEDGTDDVDCEEGRNYHDDVKSNSSEAISHDDDVSSDELSVCSDYDDDIDVEINVHSD